MLLPSNFWTPDILMPDVLESLICKPIIYWNCETHQKAVCYMLSVFFPRWWWLPVGVGWAAGDLPQRPSRAPPTLPAGAGGRLYHQEQSCQSLLHGHTCCSDLLQVQQRVGPSERAHHRGAGGRDVGSVAHTHTLTHTITLLYGSETLQPFLRCNKKCDSSALFMVFIAKGAAREIDKPLPDTYRFVYYLCNVMRAFLWRLLYMTATQGVKLV